MQYTVSILDTILQYWLEQYYHYWCIGKLVKLPLKKKKKRKRGEKILYGPICVHVYSIHIILWVVMYVQI